jgi:hypothetical protein
MPMEKHEAHYEYKSRARRCGNLALIGYLVEYPNRHLPQIINGEKGLKNDVLSCKVSLGWNSTKYGTMIFKTLSHNSPSRLRVRYQTQ